MVHFREQSHHLHSCFGVAHPWNKCHMAPALRWFMWTVAITAVAMLGFLVVVDFVR